MTSKKMFDIGVYQIVKCKESKLQNRRRNESCIYHSYFVTISGKEFECISSKTLMNVFFFRRFDRGCFTPALAVEGEVLPPATYLKDSQREIIIPCSLTVSRPESHKERILDSVSRRIVVVSLSHLWDIHFNAVTPLGIASQTILNNLRLYLRELKELIRHRK